MSVFSLPQLALAGSTLCVFTILQLRHTFISTLWPTFSTLDPPENLYIVLILFFYFVLKVKNTLIPFHRPFIFQKCIKKEKQKIEKLGSRRLKKIPWAERDRYD